MYNKKQCYGWLIFLQVRPALLLGLPYEVVDVKGVSNESTVTEFDIFGCSDPIHVQNIGVGRLIPKLINIICHLVQNPPIW